MFNKRKENVEFFRKFSIVVGTKNFLKNCSFFSSHILPKNKTKKKIDFVNSLVQTKKKIRHLYTYKRNRQNNEA